MYDLDTLIPLYTEDPVDMRYAINALMAVAHRMGQALAEQELYDLHSMERSIEDLQERLQEAERLSQYSADVADAKKGARGLQGIQGPRGDVGVRGETGERGDVLMHPIVMEALERIKDLEEQIEELNQAIKDIE